MIASLRRKHPTWNPESSTDIGRQLEVRVKQLEDGFVKGSMPIGGMGVSMNRDTIAAMIYELQGWLNTIQGGKSSGWYCFWCGYLESEEVTNGERCGLCGAKLPT